VRIYLAEDRWAFVRSHSLGLARSAAGTAGTGTLYGDTTGRCPLGAHPWTPPHTAHGARLKLHMHLTETLAPDSPHRQSRDNQTTMSMHVGGPKDF
jgi:hypothetical protein